MSEADLVRSILVNLRSYRPIGLHAWRNNTGRRAGVTFGELGSPDILGYFPWGQFLALECKMKSGKLSDKQAAWLEHAAAAGVAVLCVRTLPEALGFIDGHLDKHSARNGAV